MTFIKFGLVFIAVLFIAVIRLNSSRIVVPEGADVQITTKVVDFPIVKGTNQSFRLKGKWIRLPRFPEIHYLDEVVITAKIVDGEFKDVQLVSVISPTDIFEQVRSTISDFYAKAWAAPYSGLLSGVVLGSKSYITSGLWEDVRRTGVAHVVVASGTNVVFVASFVFGALVLFMRRPWALVLSLMAVFGYVAVAEFEAPLVRALLMYGLGVAAQTRGRLYSIGRTMALSALIMLIVVPEWIWNIGFYLSFASTVALVVLVPSISARLGKLPTLIKESLATSLAAQIGVLPAMLVFFGQLSVLAPLYNTLVLWTVPPLMIIGFVAGGLSFISFELGRLVLLAGLPFAWWFVTVVGIGR